ncbi:hypothetical protein I3843_01G076400 [Carya illinoinensis]|uniref:GRF1-interacting factor 3-like isoform X1 n=1 Tax=Carya illinoinensis TaxID=32201 RepID=UPI001BF56E4F|nr:GRF1-interacting factor 3-like isoform X1 [Carya illinoinensis]KAG2725646.1 hypothetical protein I3760_01G075800 [Carya illinoinensis]KAG7994794.1 hypothetical protein I3843_01G076400 [Carya illinoinensis]
MCPVSHYRCLGVKVDMYWNLSPWWSTLFSIQLSHKYSFTLATTCLSSPAQPPPHRQTQLTCQSQFYLKIHQFTAYYLWLQRYQAQLQKNLMYLAAIADAQPQTPAMPPQMAPHPALQQGGYYMQHPQAAAMAQQPGIFPQKLPLQYNNPHQMQDPQQQLHQQHQQAIQGQMGLRAGGANNGLHSMHTETTHGGGSSGGPPSVAGPNDVRGGSKQDGSEVGTAGADGQGSSAGGHGGGDGESSYLKGSEEAK